MIHRIQNIRSMGRSLFMNVQSGMQIYFNATESGDFSLAQTLSRGDVIEILRYEDFITRMGEPTWRIFEFRIVARCNASIPLVVEAEDVQYNQIGIDLQRRNRVLNWLINYNDLMSVRQRALIVQQIRRILEDDGAIEIETPILQPLYGGASARPFVTEHNALDRSFYLRISPELYLKRMIVAGLPFVYEFARCFRNEGIDRSHNPEFTLLEFYQVNRNWQWGMQYVEQIVSAVLNLQTPFRQFDYRTALLDRGYDVDNLSIDEMDNAFSNVERELIEPCFVINHPSSISPLAYSADGVVAQRFELYVNGMEITNGYTEQNNATVQRQRMTEMNNVDEDYINALEYGNARNMWSWIRH